MENLLHNLSDYYDGSIDPAIKLGAGFAISVKIVNWLTALFNFAFRRYFYLEMQKGVELLTKKVIEEIKKNDDGK